MDNKTSKTSSKTSLPGWWTSRNSADWERVKAALRRDWEQTKADFSDDPSRNLNQSLSDTIQQSVGEQAIPAPGVKSHPTEDAVAIRDADDARRSMDEESVLAAQTVANAQADISGERERLHDRVQEVRKDLAMERAKATDQKAEAELQASERDAAARVKALGQISEAQRQASAGIAKGQATVEEAGARRDRAIARWRDAEQQVRYGFGVRGQYPPGSVWDGPVEEKLRAEWNALDTGVTWDSSKTSIRRGWEYADADGADAGRRVI